VVFSDDITLAWTSYVQPRFDEFEDVTTISEGGVESDVSDLPALTVTVRLRYDSTPPDGVEKRDTSLLTGLLVGF
jgi:hypothetical protein